LAHFALGPYRLEVAEVFGPRITGLHRDGDEETLARLGSDVTIDHVGGVYRFHGGHRLWASPEVPEITYASDDHPCATSYDGDTVTITAGPDAAGLSKAISISAEADSLVVDHSISAESGAVGRIAAWAITQFPHGGLALVPLVGAETGPLPNRQLVMWPYTDPSDDRARLGSPGLEISARTGKPLKFGTGPARARLGYLRAGRLFIKEHISSSGEDVPDLGAGSQVYVGQGFCELETVGGLVEVSSEVTATLTERWTIVPCDDPRGAWEFLIGPGDR
jgi:hypothetical protein